MNKIKALLLAAIFSTVPAWADDIGTLETVDAIDHVFGPSGGVGTATFSSASDDDWMVFDALEGSLVNMVFNSSGSCVNVAILQEQDNGVVEVGDGANVTNFNNDLIGQGDELVVVYPTGSNDSFGTDFRLTFVPPATGQYALGFKGCNDSSSGTQFTAELSLPQEIPTMSQWLMLLMALTLGGLSAVTMFRRQKAHV